MYDIDPDKPKVDKGFVNQSTKHIKDNGWNPAWKRDNKFTFFMNPDTAYMVLKVKDKDKYRTDDDLGRKVVPMRTLRTGYRHVFLEDKDGSKIGFACVMLKVSNGV